MATLDLKSHGLELKGNVTIHGDLHFERPVLLWNGVVVNRCRIGAYSYLAPSANVLLTTIGRYCSIGDNVRIGLTEHPVDYLLTSPIAYKPVFDWHQAYTPPDSWDELRPVDIGHDVWIGAGATVLGGVRLGTGCIVATRAVVTKDVPPYAVVAGTPAKIVKMRFNEAIVQRLLALELWTYDLPKWWAQAHQTPKGPLTDEAVGTLEDAVGSGSIPRLDGAWRVLRRHEAGWTLT